MRVVLLSGPSTGGIGTHVAQLAGDLRRGGDHVRVVAPADTLARFDVGASMSWWPTEAATAADTARVRRLLRSADVVHAHGHQAGLVATALLAGRRKPALVVSWHNAVLGGGRRQGVSHLALRWVAARADLVSGASADLVEEARRLGAVDPVLAPVPSPRVPGLLSRTLDGPARQAVRTRLLGSEATTMAVILTVSRLAPQKNLAVLVAAAAMTPVARWYVVGDGDADLRADLLRQTAATGAPVHFVGSSKDVGDWLAAADLFVLPSLWEARALVVQEAMAAGLPVVASAVGGLPELLRDVGVLVPLGDDPVQGFAAAVRSLLADPQRCADMARRGRALAAALPDGPAVAQQWHERYVELTARAH